MPATLDDLLAGGARHVSPSTADAAGAFADMVADARVAAARGRHVKVARRAIGGAAVLALMAVGTAAAAGVLPGASHREAWNGPPPPNAPVFEWISTNLHGNACVERLSGIGVTDAEVASIIATLNDPSALLAKDAGAVRREFLEEGWATDSAQDVAAIDRAYAEVANLDFAAGRGSLRDDQLTSDFITGRRDELFQHVYWRLIIDGVGGGPHGYHEKSLGMQGLNPETACEVTE